MMAGGLPQVARAALTTGASALDAFVVKVLQPVQPMLADSAADVNDALAVLGEAALEYKLDGARIQVHKVDDEVRVFSRALRDVTVAVPGGRRDRAAAAVAVGDSRRRGDCAAA